MPTAQEYYNKFSSASKSKPQYNTSLTAYMYSPSAQVAAPVQTQAATPQASSSNGNLAQGISDLATGLVAPLGMALAGKGSLVSGSGGQGTGYQEGGYTGGYTGGYGRGYGGGGSGGGGASAITDEQRQSADFLTALSKKGVSNIKQSVDRTMKMADDAAAAVRSSAKAQRNAAGFNQDSDYMLQRLKALYSDHSLQDSAGVAGMSGGGFGALNIIRNTLNDAVRSESVKSLRSDYMNVNKEESDALQAIKDTKNQSLIDATNQMYEGVSDFLAQLFANNPKFIDGTEGTKLYDREKGEVTYPDWVPDFFKDNYQSPEVYKTPSLFYGDNEAHNAAMLSPNKAAAKTPVSRMSSAVNPEYVRALAVPYRQRGGNSRI